MFRVQIVAVLAGLTIGCSSWTPCLSTVTTSVESGVGRSRTTDRSDDSFVGRLGRDVEVVDGLGRSRGRGSEYDVRAGVSFEWDATGSVCRPEAE